MDQIPESESTQSNSEYALPFQVKEEILSSDEESGAISHVQPTQKTETATKMDQIPETPEWNQSLAEVALPFAIKEETISSDDESEANSRPPQQKETNEEKSGQEDDYFSKEQKKRERTRFNIFQRAELEKAFAASPYLAPRHRYAMAARLGVKPVAIQSWFKNRRFKWRREAKEGSCGSSHRLNQRLAAAKAYMPFVYQAPCGYDTGRIQLAPCQGCCKGNLTEEPYKSAFYKYPPN